MPKENVHTKDPLERVEVRWQPDQYVQIGTVKLATPDSEIAGVEGIYLDLDRYGVNRLITALRRARDAVFGRDV